MGGSIRMGYQFEGSSASVTGTPGILFFAGGERPDSV